MGTQSRKRSPGRDPVPNSRADWENPMSAKVLVIDDDPFLLQNLETLLTRQGYLVRCASSGEEGLSMLTDEPADLVVLDLGLPGIDGVTTCRRLRARWHMPVLMLTARTDAM